MWATTPDGLKESKGGVNALYFYTQFSYHTKKRLITQGELRLTILSRWGIVLPVSFQRMYTRRRL